MTRWELAVDPTAALPCAAAGADGRLKPVDVSGFRTAPPDPAAGEAERLGALLRCAAESGAARHGGGGPGRVAVVHPLGWDEAQFEAARRQALAADLPPPVFVAAPTALARYFRARLALPESTCVAVYDARPGSVAVALVRNTAAGPTPVFQGTSPALPSTGEGPAAEEAAQEAARARIVSELAALVEQARLRTGELAAVYLTGDAARLPGAATRVRRSLGLTAFVTDRPDTAAVLGALIAADDAESRLGPTQTPPGPLTVPAPRTAPAGGDGPTVDPAAALAAATLAAAALMGRATTAAALASPTDATDSDTDGRTVALLRPTPPVQAPEPALEAGAATVVLGKAAPLTAAPQAEDTAETQPLHAFPFAPVPAVPDVAAPGGSAGLLHTALSDLPAPYRDGPPDVPPGRGRRRGMWLPAAIVVAAAAGGVLSFTLLNGHGGHTGPHRTPQAAPPVSVSAALPQPAAPTGLTGSPSASASPSPTVSSSPSAGTPAAVLDAYFAAINSHDYQQAWQLGAKNLNSDYATFVSGLSGTVHDDAIIQDESPTVADVDLTATQADGSVKQFTGTYTVVGGVITQAHMQAAS
ncbi:hypothetical protein GXW83_13760 [Streptacidiphilus sp. PB12-B1b]|uniref:hypothetical protein n=1 Tax=Streptacidiphilus sp. PB12-B1b TaxID=2705012 RepID=UPI0015FAD6A9|nr:hypothetical protein [Streptacidiphilus sp. PB12-B1b]QMU76653.1 hypothetical protein GXW83_13760 [Streptacidiphilus sp. PB12-B1b]